MIRRLAGRGGLLAVIVFAGYLASYALLWTTQEEKLFALTREHGCFVQKRDVPALRYVWTQQPGLAAALCVVHGPVNSLLESHSRWR